MKTRLRDYPTSFELQVLYPRPHVHTRWVDHVIRVEETIAMAKRNLTPEPGLLIADLSCGDAAIARALEEAYGADLVLGDLAPGYAIEGPIEQTMPMAACADLLILSETLEHLEDPELVLRMARHDCLRLLLSTPADETPADGNPEHIWAWSVEDVRAMLEATGWKPVEHKLLELKPKGFVYDFQLWFCE